jgi:tRNA modification GTPase
MQQRPADTSSQFLNSSASGYMSEDTIVSRISGTGGAISVLRVSGPGTFGILRSLCSKDIEFMPRRMERVRLQSPSGEFLDDSMVVGFPGPNSFTGEDVAEIFLHGGAFITGLVLREILRMGARQALPGEFSFRAVRNGKLTIDQAQAIHDLVSATNSSAHGLALERLSGAQSKIFFEIAEELRRTLVLAEAGIDFSDQDLDELELQRLKNPLSRIVEHLQSIASSIDRGRRIQEGVSLVLAGLPNAGKSTLFNELLGQERSIISEEAGTTRDVVREAVRLRNSPGDTEATFVVHDTAGLRETDAHVEKLGIELTRKAAASADVVIFVVEPGSNDDLVAAEWARLGEPRGKTILVLNKTDRLPGGPEGSACRAEHEKWRALIGATDSATVSAVGHSGIPELIGLLIARAAEWVDRKPAETILTRQEQVDAVERAMEHLRRALRADAHDIFAADVRQTLDQLSFFIGATPVDDVLGRIFSQFCIGK